MDDTPERIDKAVLAASRAIDRGDLDEAAGMVAETEAAIAAGTCAPLTPELRGNLGGVVIDLGTCLSDEPMVERGLNYTSQAVDAQGENPSEAFLYNAGNGYSTLWSLRRPKAMQQGYLEPSHVQAKAFYRRALDLSKSTLSLRKSRQHNQLLVNYANCLDSVGRCVEAIEYYFLDEIKEDYVLARYLLVQSQYRSDLAEAIDQDVSLYYPLDYSVHGAYVQMMKASLRMAMDVLDKIACFLRDYCRVTSVRHDRTYFSSLWSDRDTPLQLLPELQTHSNRFLFGLFDLSRDLSHDGYYHHLCERRNELTHRFLAVHDMLSSKQHDDLPRVTVSQFRQECTQAMQIARAAVMYLVLFVDSEERKAAKSGLYGSVYGVPVDDTFRWIPGRGGV